MTDAERLDRILSTLPADDAAYLSALVEPPWRQRARRLAQRDAAIRRALAMLGGDGPNPAARLAALLTRQAGDRWGTTGNHLVVEAVSAVLALNDGAPMSERHIRNVSAGDRTPPRK